MAVREEKSSAKHRAWLCADRKFRFELWTNRGSGSCEVTLLCSLYPGRMAADDPLRNEPLVSVEFEVFGKVQGKSEKFYRAEDRRVFG